MSDLEAFFDAWDLLAWGSAYVCVCDAAFVSIRMLIGSSAVEVLYCFVTFFLGDVGCCGK